MAKQPNMTTVTTGWNSQTTINNNLTALSNSFDNTLSLDGSTPNAMGADLDMNSNDINNVANIATDTLSVGGTTVVASGLTSVPSWEGPWVTSTAYVLNDLVSQSGNSYICLVAHTSGTFSTDLTANKWEIFAEKGTAGAGTGDMIAANDLSDVASVATSRANLGLGTAATTASSDYATAAQGVTADAALPASDVLDEDTMTTDSATKPPSQQSTKAYVDTQVATVASPIHAWGLLNGSGTPAWTAESGMSATITDNGTGDYTINFDTAVSDANYAVLVDGLSTSTDQRVFAGVKADASGDPVTKSTTQVRIFTTNVNGTPIDSKQISITIVR